jgi:hypothetical protein
MKEKDAKSCLPDTLKKELRDAWNELLLNKSGYPLFWDFIHRERNNIMKEYEFSAYEAIIKPDGTTRSPKGLLSIMEEGEKEALLIRNGRYKDRQALDVLTDSAAWVENYILTTIKKAGYDPDETRIAGSLLPLEHIASSRDTLLSALSK